MVERNDRVPHLLLRLFDSKVMWYLADGELTLQHGRVTFGLTQK